MMIVMIVMIMLMTRYRMTPPESPRDREGPSAELAGAQERGDRRVANAKQVLKKDFANHDDLCTTTICF